MQSAKKTKRILSALSMAAAGALAARTAHGMTLTTYYGNDPSYANSNNGLIIGTGLAPTGVSTNATGGLQYFTNETNVPVAGGIQTITLPVGDYLSLAIDALLTGNLNADAGVNAGTGTKPTNHQLQPSFLGLSQLDINIPSSNTTGNILSPITFSPSPNIGNPAAGYTGTVYFATTNINSSGGNSSVGLGANGGTSTGSYNTVPDWISIDLHGGVEPNNGASGEPSNAPKGWNNSTGANPTTDTGTNASGTVGINEDPSAGNDSANIGPSNTAAGVAGVETYASSNTNITYSSATEFMDSLIYQGLSAGLVTLSPYVNTAATAYWTRATAGSTTTPTTYTTQGFNATAETITNVPLLVIDVVGVTSSTASAGHAIVALAATAGANSNYPTAVTGTFSPATNAGAGQITITGSGGSYVKGEVTAINGGAGLATGNVGVTTWNPATDPEIYGVDVEVGGQQATGTQLAALIAAIGGDGVAPASVGVVAATTDPTHGDLSALDTAGTTYNLFLTFAGGGPGASDDLGLDLSSSNDSNLTGYTFTAVAAVPEPMSLGLLAIGGVGLMARRSRRKA
jgi:hypothetical protein